MDLETTRLNLRQVALDDAELMLAIWNDPSFIANVSDRGIRTPEQAREALRDGALKLFQDYGYGPCVVSLKSNTEMIGICGLFKRDNLQYPDIGFALLPEYRSQGYGREAAQAVVDYARHQTDVEVLTAIVSPGNGASIGVIESLGMTFERSLTMPGDRDPSSLYSMRLND